jgi:N-acetylmuramoyl-L-alanine amidase
MMTKIVVGDGGHGDKDPGAIGFGLLEKDLCLDRMKRIKKKLESEYEGVKFLLTRSTDEFLELTERANIANRAKADLFISDHKNGSKPEARGFETFVYTNASAASKSYQNIIHVKIISKLSKFGIPDRGKKKANLSVLRNTNMPAILLEEGFITNRADNRLMQSPDFVEAYIEGIVEGIAQCLGLKKKVVIPQSKPVPKEEEPFMLEKAVVINSFADYPVAEMLAIRLGAPIYPRSVATKSQVAKELFVIGGNVDGLKGKATVLSGKNRFDTAAKVNAFLK